MASRIQIEEHVIHKEFVAIQQHVDVGVRELRFERVVDIAADTLRQMAYRLSGYVWAQDIQNETVSFSAEWPATWWQHFKLRWFPAVALRKWPAVMASKRESHEFKTIALLPDFKYVAPPECGRHVFKTQVGRK